MDGDTDGEAPTDVVTDGEAAMEGDCEVDRDWAEDADGDVVTDVDGVADAEGVAVAQKEAQVVARQSHVRGQVSKPQRLLQAPDSVTSARAPAARARRPETEHV